MRVAVRNRGARGSVSEGAGYSEKRVRGVAGVEPTNGTGCRLFLRSDASRACRAPLESGNRGESYRPRGGARIGLARLGANRRVEIRMALMG